MRLLDERADGAALPETVQGIIAARLDVLDRDEKELLQDAAVLGRVFWVGGLGTRARRGGGQRSIDSERREFVQRERRSTVAGETEYAFRHALVREVAYEQIPRAQRGDKHRRVADWLETLGRSEDLAELLAHHYIAVLEYSEPDAELATGPHARLGEAGDRALALNAYRRLRVSIGARSRSLLTRSAGSCSSAWATRSRRWRTRRRQNVLSKRRRRSSKAGDMETAAEAECCSRPDGVRHG